MPNLYSATDDFSEYQNRYIEDHIWMYGSLYLSVPPVTGNTPVHFSDGFHNFFSFPCEKVYCF